MSADGLFCLGRRAIGNPSGDSRILLLKAGERSWARGQKKEASDVIRDYARDARAASQDEAAMLLTAERGHRCHLGEFGN